MASYKVTLISEGEGLNSLLKYLMTNTFSMLLKNKVSTFHIPAELEHVQHVLEKLLPVV